MDHLAVLGVGGISAEEEPLQVAGLDEGRRGPGGLEVPPPVEDGRHRRLPPAELEEAEEDERSEKGEEEGDPNLLPARNVPLQLLDQAPGQAETEISAEVSADVRGQAAAVRHGGRHVSCNREISMILVV